MLRFITKLACAGFIFALPLQAMQLEQEQEAQSNNQEQSQVKEVKSLKVQALLQVAQSPQISDDQINQIPQDLQKIARLIRKTEGDLGKALLCALKARKYILKVAQMLATSKVDNQNLFVYDFWYSLDDIRLLINCCKDEEDELNLLHAIRFQDNELLELIGKKTLSKIVHDELISTNGNTGEILLRHLLISVNGHKFEAPVKDRIKSAIELVICCSKLNKLPIEQQI